MAKLGASTGSAMTADEAGCAALLLALGASAVSALAVFGGLLAGIGVAAAAEAGCAALLLVLGASAVSASAFAGGLLAGIGAVAADVAGCAAPPHVSGTSTTSWASVKACCPW